MNQEMVTEKILSYMKDQSRNLPFSIGMYGPWGSGKTYYCENVLKPELEKEDYGMLRISLFGIESVDGFYERALAAYCRLDKNDLAHVLTKSALKTIVSVVDSKLSNLGIQLDVKPNILFSVLDMSRVLLVIDDIERSSLSSESEMLFGMINDMVENHGCRVLFIRNSPLNLTDSSAEKAILFQLSYEPAVEDLYDAIAGSKLSEYDYFDFNVRDAALAGMRSVARINARAFQKALPALCMALSTKALSNSRVASEGRAKAFSDFTKHALRAAAGNPPAKAKDSDNEFSYDFLRLAEYEEYHLLESALGRLLTGGAVDAEEVEKCMEAYIADRYPDSEADTEMEGLYEKYGRIAIMEDDEVESLAKDLSLALRANGFSYNWIYRAWKMASTLIELGFREQLNSSEVCRLLSKIIDKDPYTASEKLNGEYEDWKGQEGVEQSEEMDHLLEYARQRVAELQREDISAKLGSNKVSAETGRIVAEQLNDMLDTGKRLDVIPAEIVVDCFVSGSAESQMSLRGFFGSSLNNRLGALRNFSKETLEWLKCIESGLDAHGPTSRMSAMRTKYFKKDIAMVRRGLARFENGAQLHDERAAR